MSHGILLSIETVESPMTIKPVLATAGLFGI